MRNTHCPTIHKTLESSDPLKFPYRHEKNTWKLIFGFKTPMYTWQKRKWNGNWDLENFFLGGGYCCLDRDRDTQRAVKETIAPKVLSMKWEPGLNLGHIHHKAEHCPSELSQQFRV